MGEEKLGRHHSAFLCNLRDTAPQENAPAAALELQRAKHRPGKFQKARAADDSLSLLCFGSNIRCHLWDPELPLFR